MYGGVLPDGGEEYGSGASYTLGAGQKWAMHAAVLGLEARDVGARGAQAEGTKERVAQAYRERAKAVHPDGGGRGGGGGGGGGEEGEEEGEGEEEQGDAAWHSLQAAKEYFDEVLE